MPDYAILEAPSSLGLSSAGVEQLPTALLDADDVVQLGQRDAEAAAAEGSQRIEDTAVTVAGLCRSGRAVEVVIAAAGSGKTSALAAARHAWESDGHRVLGCALAARAAQQLADGAGISSSTLDRLLLELAIEHRRLTSRDVVVVDEAGMVGTRHLERLARHTTAAKAKLVLVGDPAQLPAIAAGGAFAGLARRLGHRQLEANHRQVEPWEQEALGALRSGATRRVAAAYAHHDRLDDADVDTIIDRWARARSEGTDVLLLAARRDQVTTLNRAARARLQGDGVVGPDRCVLGRRPYAVGDHVVALRNDRRLGILNGSRGVVADIHDHHLDVELTSGAFVRLPHDYAEAGRLDHGYALTIHTAQGLTADATITLADDTLAREHAYVALSRGRRVNRFVLAPPDDLADDHFPTAPRTAAERMLPILRRSAAEDMGIDL